MMPYKNNRYLHKAELPVDSVSWCQTLEEEAKQRDVTFTVPEEIHQEVYQICNMKGLKQLKWKTVIFSWKWHARMCSLTNCIFIIVHTLHTCLMKLCAKTVTSCHPLTHCCSFFQGCANWNSEPTQHIKVLAFSFFIFRGQDQGNTEESCYMLHASEQDIYSLIHTMRIITLECHSDWRNVSVAKGGKVIRLYYQKAKPQTLRQSST